MKECGGWLFFRSFTHTFISGWGSGRSYTSAECSIINPLVMSGWNRDSDETERELVDLMPASFQKAPCCILGWWLVHYSCAEHGMPCGDHVATWPNIIWIGHVASSPHEVPDICIELLALYMRTKVPILHHLESIRPGTLGLLSLSINGIESHQQATLPCCLGQSHRRPWLCHRGIGHCCLPHAYI